MGGVETQYLLGNVSDEQRIAVEEDLFTNDSMFESLELAEDELIDGYVRNQLSDEDRRRFQALATQSPRIAERVKFARVLTSRVDAFTSEDSAAEVGPVRRSRQKESSAWWAAFFGGRLAFGTAGAVFALLFLVTAISLIGWIHIRKESARLAGERATLERQNKELAEKTSALQKQTDELTSAVQQERQQHIEDQKLIEQLNSRQPHEAGPHSIIGSILPLFLTPGGSRGSNSQAEAKLSSATAAVRLSLALENSDYRSYTLSIRAAGDEVFLTRNGVKPRNKSLVITIPASHFPPNDYVIHVDGLTDSHRVENVNDYTFRILR